MFRKIGVFILMLVLFSGCANVAGYDGRADDEDLKKYIRELCGEYGIPETLIFAVIEKESSWNADAVNYNETCFGLMQINVVNFDWLEDELELDDPKEPYQNVRAGIYMLSVYLEKYLDYHMALMCYNCGENGARQLWQDGIFTNAYSLWVIDRMHDLEWEALDAAREQLDLQASERETESDDSEKIISETVTNDEKKYSRDLIYEESSPEETGIRTVTQDTIHLEYADNPENAVVTEKTGVELYTEDIVLKNIGYFGSPVLTVPHSDTCEKSCYTRVCLETGAALVRAYAYGQAGHAVLGFITMPLSCSLCWMRFAALS